MMTRDDMAVSYVFDVNKLTVGGCYRFKCGDYVGKGILSTISPNMLVFHVADILDNEANCNLTTYEINADDFYNDTESYVYEMI